jgi:hypothetical protein
MWSGFWVARPAAAAAATRGTFSPRHRTSSPVPAALNIVSRGRGTRARVRVGGTRDGEYGNIPFPRNPLLSDQPVNSKLDRTRRYLPHSIAHESIYIYTIFKAPVSTIVMRHIFTNNLSQLFQINLLHVYTKLSNQ